MPCIVKAFNLRQRLLAFRFQIGAVCVLDFYDNSYFILVDLYLDITVTFAGLPIGIYIPG